MVLVGDETNIPDFLALATGVGDATVSGTYHRHTFGDSTSAQTRVTVGAIILDLNNGSEELAVVLSNPIVNIGDIKPTGSSGHYEIEFEARCLPKYFAMEVKD